MKRIALLLTAFFALVIAANAQGLTVGSTMENFSLPDTNGKTQTLADMKGSAGTVIVFVSAQCPVVRGYNERISQIAADYKAKGINFIGINSNSTESLADVKAHTEQNYKFTVLIDKANVIADKVGANSTPEVLFLDGKNKLVYRGAIDNDRTGKSISENYLTAAFDASLGGKPVAKSSTTAIGCSIKRIGD